MGNNCTCSFIQQKQEMKKKSTRKYVNETQNPFYEDPAANAVLNNLTGTHVPLADKYSLGRKLGRGEFGIAHLCVDNETGESLACKSIPKRKLRRAIDVADVRREAAVMTSLPPHPNIVRLRSAHEDRDFVHLVMDLCEGGELFDRVAARGRYDERAAANVVRTVAEVVKACHENGVMHRDLKLENFLFVGEEEGSALKAIDFGVSAFFEKGERFSEIVGSPYYIAPEVLKRDYGPEIDVWSAGVMLCILLSGVPPFWAETEMGIAQAILHGTIDFEREPWPWVSDGAKSLLLQMLEPDPVRRLTAQEVLEHPWLQNANEATRVPLGREGEARTVLCYEPVQEESLRVIAEDSPVEEVQVISDMFKMTDTENNGVQKVGSKLDEPDMSGF